MEHRTMEEMARLAQVAPVDGEHAANPRRQRLERLALLLEKHSGQVHLLSRIEFMPGEKRAVLRRDGSPLSIAFADAEFRSQGLAGDRLGDATAFFELSDDEAHHLFCDCHYVSAAGPAVVAARARALAHVTKFADRPAAVLAAVADWWRSLNFVSRGGRQR